MEAVPEMPPPAPLSAGCRFTVETGPGGDIVVAAVGDLDPRSARALVDLVESAIGTAETGRGIEVDLRRLRSCSNSGVRALTYCAELGARLHDGLHFRVGLTANDPDYGDTFRGTLPG